MQVRVCDSARGNTQLSLSLQFFPHQLNSGSKMSGGDPQAVPRQLTIADDGPLRIHVGNIPFSWSDKHLREQFDVSRSLQPLDDLLTGCAV